MFASSYPSRYASLAIVAAAALAARADDVDILYERFRVELTDRITVPDEADARASMAGLRADGTWPDVDLSITDQVNWTPRIQLSRIASLYKAYLTPGHALAGNAAVAAKASAALDAYIKADPVSTNWWFNEIGAQLAMGPVIYLMGGKLTPSQKQGTDLVMARSWKDKGMTGENLVWVASATAWRAAFNHDEALLSEAVRAIGSTISVTTSEGVQADFSFHQHGAQLYNGGYGAAFAVDGCALAADFGGTKFAFAAAQLAVLRGLMLEGQRWMVRGGMVDHSVRGREVTRVNAGSAGAFADAADNLAGAIPEAAAELKAFSADIRAQRGSSVTGTKWFWRGEYLASHRPTHMVSLRMADKHVQASEIINLEGLLSTYLADGATLFYRSGQEYTGIFPVWDWSHIPGTTTAHAATTPRMTNPPFPGNGAFAGGTSDGTYGAAVFAYDKLGVKAHKAWFFFDRQMTALGAGIESAGKEPVHTTLNQTLLNGAVACAAADGNVRSLAPGATLPASTRWVMHDRIGYYLPGSPQAAVAIGPATGNWKRINNGSSDAAVTENVFGIWLDHGEAPAGAGYDYTTVLDADAAGMAAYAKNPEVVTLSNTPALQAVRQRILGVTGAAFHAPGSLQVTQAFSVAPSRACILLIREGDGTLTISAADPARGSAALAIRIDAKLTGPGAVWSETEKATSLVFVMPSGEDSAGATVTHTYLAPGAAIAPQRTPAVKRESGKRLRLRSGAGWRFGRPGAPRNKTVTAEQADARGREAK